MNAAGRLFTSQTAWLLEPTGWQQPPLLLLLLARRRQAAAAGLEARVGDSSSGLQPE
jgi:hypothetical protein